MKQSIWKNAMLAAGLVLVAGAVHAAVTITPTPPPAGPCSEADNGSGTVTLPPANCQYLSADQVHFILAGLPAGTTIILKPIHTNFICREMGICGTPGGVLGGEIEQFSSNAVFHITGTGALAGWSRDIVIPLNTETHTGPRPLGAPVQDFPTDMQRIQGSISGDPDFASLTLIGGSANGFPSPGHTRLTRPAGSTVYTVDSRFDIGYTLSFVGAPGGKLDGMSGTTQGTVSMEAYAKK